METTNTTATPVAAPQPVAPEDARAFFERIFYPFGRDDR